MATYRYQHVGPCGRIHCHLSVGVGIVLRVDTTTGTTPPHGSTVQLEPGDVLVTSQPYEHPELLALDVEAITRPVIDPDARRAPTAPTANPRRIRVPAQRTP